MAFTTKDGQVVRDTSINAPTYNDPFFDFMGETYQNAFATDPALAMTLSAGGQGGLSHGVGAFLNPNAAYAFNNTGKEGVSNYDTAQMQELAKQFGYDVSAYTEPDKLQGYLDSQLKDYYGISGLSAGWNPTGDARQANNTLYKRENGKLVPYGTAGYSAPEKGSWLQENPEALYVLGVAGAGAGALAAGYGAGLGGGAGAAGTGAAAAGSAPAYMGVGTAGAGAAGEGLTGLGALQGAWAGLPGWGQGALTGAAQGGISSGIQGKNILSGALMGGLTGGVGAWGGQALSGLTGMPAWASKGLVSAGLGGLQGGWQGALGAGLGSLAASGMGELGMNGQLAGKLGGLAGNYAAGSILGGAQGGSGGVGSGVGMLGASGTAGTAGTGLAGVGMTPRLGAASAQEKAWMNTAYAPIAIEAQKKKLAQQVREEGGLAGLA